MWCTRWFIPLMILPLPTAPPYFLMIFMFSLSLHSRPCFYCMVILTVLFSSSCYWQPVPLSTPLTSPIPISISTYSSPIFPSSPSSSVSNAPNPLVSSGPYDGLSLHISSSSENATTTTVTTYATTFGAFLLHNLTASFPDAVKEVEIVVPDEAAGVWGEVWKRRGGWGRLGLSSISGLRSGLGMGVDVDVDVDMGKEAGTTTETSGRPKFTLPSTISLAERCWCGITSTSSPYPSISKSSTLASPEPPFDAQTYSKSIFDPTSVSAWERASLERVLKDVRRQYVEVVRESRESREREKEGKSERREETRTEQTSQDASLSHAQASSDTKVHPDQSQDQHEYESQHLPLLARLRHTLRSWSIITFPLPSPASASYSTAFEPNSPSPQASMPQTAPSSRASRASSRATPSSPRPSSSSKHEISEEGNMQPKRDPTRPDGVIPATWKGLPWLRKEYDFLPYGVDLVLDFGWGS